MYTLFKNIGPKKIVTTEVPALGLALIIAEAFFKFGSFTLECGAFLSTWYCISFFLNYVFVIGRVRKTKYKELNPIKPE